MSALKIRQHTAVGKRCRAVQVLLCNDLAAPVPPRALGGVCIRKGLKASASL